ncbi:MAG: hypothetical protein NOOUEUKL_001613 [Candidatus Fervidibacter sp.]
MNVDKDLMDFVGYTLISIGYMTGTWISYKVLELITHKVYWDKNTRLLVLSSGLSFFLLALWHLIKYLTK